MTENDEAIIDVDLASVRLEDLQSVQNQPGIESVEKKKVPRRILHFSDGTLEEYSSDEDEVDYIQELPIDPGMLPWPRRCWFYLSAAASNTLSVADYCGEKLASFFGITTPKYQYIMDEYQRRLAEEKADQEMEERERQRHIESM